MGLLEQICYLVWAVAGQNVLVIVLVPGEVAGGSFAAEQPVAVPPLSPRLLLVEGEEVSAVLVVENTWP